MGFSMRGANVSNEYFKPPEPTQEQKQLSDMRRDMQRMGEEARLQVQRQMEAEAERQRKENAVSNSEGGIRAAVEEIRRKAEEAVKAFWKTGSSGDGRSDDEKYGAGPDGKGFKLPRYSIVEKALGHYTSAEVFDPKQTLFRYDPQTLNNIARWKFYEDPAHAGKDFIPPHDTSKPVYEGLPDRRGVIGKLARAWFDSNDGSNRGEVGNYLFDIRDYKDKFGQDIQQKLDAGHGVAVRAWVAIPGQPPNTISNADIVGWKLGDEMFETDPKTGKTEFVRAVQVSQTVGGGEQVVGKIEAFFRFFRRDIK